ncbi:hypothetical protein BBW65_05030 [Helicobacter enhydrae]|uniref:Glycosyltransferase family 8 protein n=1 Tax=Helicobacter enhydrae TaxID=222136 RepID=A0A1B1U622_9HELI|nr:glycosyltransferase family 8 protein [Helicobacter enhydrae]ANV98200.1 hypothetical protein BBW65_05030 [Helicobacter enhydrae]
MQEIPLMFCFDSNYVIPASVAFYSLLESNTPPPPTENLKFKLFVVHNDISQEDQEKLQLTIKPFCDFASLEFIDANQYLKDVWKKMSNKYHFAYEVFYKLIAPSLFPQYDKIIISDVDVCFLNDITKSFWDFDVDEEYVIGGVVSNDPDAFFPIPNVGWRSGYKKFNSEELKAIQHGIDGAYLIINLKQWRENKIQERAIDYLKKSVGKLVLAEQDVLGVISFPYIKKISPAHIVCNTSWEVLGKEWKDFKPNVYTQEEIWEARDKPIQIHFAGANKPWNTPSVPMADLWFVYLCKTPFLQDYLRKMESIMFQKFQRTFLPYRILNFVKKNPLFFLDTRVYTRILTLVFGSKNS